MDEIRYQNLLQCLKDGKCVLVVGPELFKHEGRLLRDAICGHIDVDKNPYVEFFDPKDELFYFKGKNLAVSKNAVYRQIREFYNGLTAGPLHEKIAQLPFPLIINTGPDLLLANTFEKNKFNHEFRFYNKNLIRDTNNVSHDPAQEEAFDASSLYPLLYNLNGHIGYEESLILTYSDLFDFLFNVFGRNNLPLSLRHILEIQDGEEAKDYLFLGFRFNKWYLQVILRLLNAQAGNQRFALGEGLAAVQAQADNPLTEDKGIFYLQDYFTLDLIECTPESILERLFADCQKAGKLRTPTPDSGLHENALPATNQPLYMTLQDWLMRNKIRKIFEAIRLFANQNGNEPLLSQVLIQSAKYEELLMQESKGLLFIQELSVEKSKVLNALNAMIQDVKKTELTVALS